YRRRAARGHDRMNRLALAPGDRGLAALAHALAGPAAFKAIPAHQAAPLLTILRRVAPGLGERCVTHACKVSFNPAYSSTYGAKSLGDQGVFLSLGSCEPCAAGEGAGGTKAPRAHQQPPRPVLASDRGTENHISSVLFMPL